MQWLPLVVKERLHKLLWVHILFLSRGHLWEEHLQLLDRSDARECQFLFAIGARILVKILWNLLRFDLAYRVDEGW